MTARPATVRILLAAPAFAAEGRIGPHSLPSDEPADLGGGDTGPTPDEHLLNALGACTAITLRMYAERKQWPLAEVEVSLSYAAREKGRTVIDRKLRLEGGLSDEQRQRLLEIANACPVHKILTGAVEIPTSL